MIFFFVLLNHINKNNNKKKDHFLKMIISTLELCSLNIVQHVEHGDSEQKIIFLNIISLIVKNEKKVLLELIKHLKNSLLFKLYTLEQNAKSMF